MSWNLIQNLFDGQGLVFWAAVSAVALGLTMLSVSIVFQVRKITDKARLRRGGRPVPEVAKAVADTGESGITVTEDVYTASGFVPAVATGPAPVRNADTLLVSLLDRLKSSADRLENIHASLDSNNTAPGRNLDSGLKEGAEGVDYIYRTGRA